MKAPLHPVLAKALRSGKNGNLTRKKLMDLRNGTSVVEIDGVKYQIKRLSKTTAHSESSNQ